MSRLLDCRASLAMTVRVSSYHLGDSLQGFLISILSGSMVEFPGVVNGAAKLEALEKSILG
jgi:hypothetical protein